MIPKIFSFYSYKGGVGRTFALANVATVLSMRRYKVLIIDWDIEAPGLRHYFSEYIVTQKKGIIDFIDDCTKSSARKELDNYLSKIEILHEAGVLSIDFIDASGVCDAGEYTKILQGINWDVLFKEYNFGQHLESLRGDMISKYDFVLLDCRTGLTDFTGITNVMMPDVLVFFYTLNKQSIFGSKEVIARCMSSRHYLNVDRNSLACVPILARVDMNNEYDLSREWLALSAKEFAPLVSDWTNSNFYEQEIHRHLSIPYVSKWTFGERLSVLSEIGESQRASYLDISYSIELIASIIERRLTRIEDLADNRDDYVYPWREDVAPQYLWRPSNLPFSSMGSLFKGREDEIEALAGLLESSRDGRAARAAVVTSSAIHGLGGIGKTRLAVEYARIHADRYSALLFLSAETPEILNAGLSGLVDHGLLDLPEQMHPRDEVRIPAVLKWLARNPTWLLILDGVDTEKARATVQALLPKLAGGHVLITSRLTSFAPSVGRLQLEALVVEDAVAYLLEATPSRPKAADDAERARDLAGELGGLALGLAQAAAYMEAECVSFRRYLEIWRSNRDEVLSWFDPYFVSYNHEVGLAATWISSFEQLSPAARALMDRLAFFAPEPIPDRMLDEADRIAAEVAGEATSGIDTRATIAELWRYSLADRPKEADGPFAVHRLVQDFTRRRMSGDRRRTAITEALTWIEPSFRGMSGDVRNWPVQNPLVAHAEAVIAAAETIGAPEPAGTLMNNLALLYRAKARFGPAEPLMRRALSIAEAAYGADHPSVANGLNNLASLLRDTNRLGEAEPLFRRALAIDEAAYGPDHPEVARDLNNLASLLQATNRLGEAEAIVRRALAIDEASYGPDHSEVARDLNNLASLLQATNRLGEAEPLVRRALAIDEAAYGPDHPEVARDLNNFASLLRATNRLGEAEPLFRRALAIDETAYGPDHPTVANGLNNLASLLRDTNRLGEAEPLFRRALAIDEAAYGPDHPTVANGLNNLASLLRDTNRLGEAEPLFRRALAIDEAAYGPDHPTVANGLNNLASLLRDTNRLGEAEPLFRRALAILIAFGEGTGHEHPNFRTAIDNLVELLAARGRAQDEIDTAMAEFGLSRAAPPTPAATDPGRDPIAPRASRNASSPAAPASATGIVPVRSED